MAEFLPAVGGPRGCSGCTSIRVYSAPCVVPVGVRGVVTLHGSPGSSEWEAPRSVGRWGVSRGGMSGGNGDGVSTGEGASADGECSWESKARREVEDERLIPNR